MREGWKEVDLGDYIETQKGFAFKSSWYNSFGVPVVRVSDFTENSISTNEINYISNNLAQEHIKHELQFRDILIQTVGSWQSNPASIVGKVVTVPIELEGALLNQNAVKIIPKSGIDKRFLYYRLKEENFKFHNLNHAQGAANQASITLESIKKFNFLLPPLPTQRKIASILSSYDDLIENNLKRIKLLEEKAQRTYEEWFVKMRFPGHETSVFNQETGLPEGWEKVKVDTLLDKVKSTTKIKSSEILSNGKFPVIDQSRDFVAGYTDDETALLEINEPLIVFGDHTRIVKFVNFNFARGADGTQLILSNSKRMPQHLFYQTLLSIDLSNYHYARHFKFLKDCEVLLPIQPVSESYEIIAKPMYEMINKLRTQNRLLKEARDILLPRLMSGMVDVEELVGLDAGEVECVDKTKI